MTNFAKARDYSDFFLEEAEEGVRVYDRHGKACGTISPIVAHLWKQCDGATDHDALARTLAKFGDEYACRGAVNLGLHRLSAVGLLETPMFLPPRKPQSRRKLLSWRASAA